MRCREVASKNDKKHRISLRAAAEFNSEHSNVLDLRVLDATINETRQEIITKIEMDSMLSFDDLYYLPINVIELRSQLSLIINLSSDDIKDILKSQKKSFNAELYILSKDIEITERKNISAKDSLSQSRVIVNMSLEKEIDNRLNEMDYAIEVINKERD